MTLDNFRIYHSKLIEQYQYIEYRLEGLYAKYSQKDFFQGIADVENFTLSRLITAIEKLQKEQNILILNDELYQRVKKIQQERNYWVHNCYWNIAITAKDHVETVKHQKDILRISNALREAEELQFDLYNLYTNN